MTFKYNLSFAQLRSKPMRVNVFSKGQFIGKGSAKFVCELPDYILVYMINDDTYNKLLLNIIKPNNEVDLSTFNSGIYFLKLSTANNTYTQKIIKE